MTINKKLREILACPKCKGDLEYHQTQKKEYFDCRACQLRYRVEDDIPIMLIDEAEKIK